MMLHFGCFVILLAVITNCVPVHGRDCEMDCTDLQVQQSYRPVADAGNA